MVQKRTTYHISFIFLIIFLIFFANNSPAEMNKLSDTELEKTIGAGLAISFTGDIIVDLTGDISFATGTGDVSLSGMALSDCRIEPLLYDGDIHPLKIDVAVDNSDPCIPDGTGYINVDLPSISLITGVFSADLATDDDKLFGLSYSTANLSLYSGNIKIFAH